MEGGELGFQEMGLTVEEQQEMRRINDAAKPARKRYGPAMQALLKIRQHKATAPFVMNISD